MNKTTEILINGEKGFVTSSWFEDMMIYIKDAMEEWSVANTEIKFQYEWAKLSTMHRIGSLILENEEKVSVDSLVSEVARKVELSAREIYYCLKFAKSYPKIDKVPEGKSISWSRLKKTYLTESAGPDPKECPHTSYREEVILICNDCGKRSINHTHES